MEFGVKFLEPSDIFFGSFEAYAVFDHGLALGRKQAPDQVDGFALFAFGEQEKL